MVDVETGEEIVVTPQKTRCHNALLAQREFSGTHGLDSMSRETIKYHEISGIKHYVRATLSEGKTVVLQTGSHCE